MRIPLSIIFTLVKKVSQEGYPGILTNQNVVVLISSTSKNSGRSGAGVRELLPGEAPVVRLGVAGSRASLSLSFSLYPFLSAVYGVLCLGKKAWLRDCRIRYHARFG